MLHGGRSGWVQEAGRVEKYDERSAVALTPSAAQGLAGASPAGFSTLLFSEAGEERLFSPALLSASRKCYATGAGTKMPLKSRSDTGARPALFFTSAERLALMARGFIGSSQPMATNRPEGVTSDFYSLTIFVSFTANRKKRQAHRCLS
jgi:hypothetical protein